MNDNVTNEAVLFLDDNHVVKEMLSPEFYAILDHVVSVSEFANKNTKAVYLRVNTDLHITAAVFFTLKFNADGFADSTWNIPLQHLADTAANNVDLGAGPIKLSCRSQCSVSWHQRMLWDPILDTSKVNTLAVLVHCIEKNRLGFDVNNEAIKTAIPKEISAVVTRIDKKSKNDHKDDYTVLRQDYKRRIGKIKLDAQSQIETFQKLCHQKIKDQNKKLELTKNLFLEEKNKNLQLRKYQEKTSSNLKKERLLLQDEINDKDGENNKKIILLEEKFALEMNANINSVKSEFQEKIDTRDMELFYRDEQIKRLSREAALLREEKESILNGGDRLLSTLAQKGISLLAYQPGMEEMTIPLAEVSDYLESPIKYMVGKLSLDEFQYRQWLGHYEISICQHVTEGGMQCAKPIPKVETPAHFIAGDSDRCEKHKDIISFQREVLNLRGDNE